MFLYSAHILLNLTLVLSTLLLCFRVLPSLLPLWLPYNLTNQHNHARADVAYVRRVCAFDRLPTFLHTCKTRMIISQTFLLEFYLSLTGMKVDVRRLSKIHFYSFV